MLFLLQLGLSQSSLPILYFGHHLLASKWAQLLARTTISNKSQVNEISPRGLQWPMIAHHPAHSCPNNWSASLLTLFSLGIMVNIWARLAGLTVAPGALVFSVLPPGEVTSLPAAAPSPSSNCTTANWQSRRNRYDKASWCHCRKKYGK